MTRFISNCAFVLIFFILFASAIAPLQAQTGSIRLEGTVWDPAGNPLPGAILTAVEDRTGVQSVAVSNEEGDYKFLALRPGTYTITLKAKEFKDVVHRGVTLLTPGVVEEIFTIEAAAVDVETPLQEHPRFIDSQASSALSQRELQARPILDRNPLSQMIYLPGAEIKTGDEGKSSFNGSRPSTNNIVMDGISVADPVDPSMAVSLWPANPDSISEIQIISSGAKAEYGRSGAQFNLIPKTGRQSWSGNVYDYFQNQSFNANDYFYNKNGNFRPQLRKNQFGASLAGPVFSKKTQFFLNFEGSRAKQDVYRNRLVLTDEAKKGIFQYYLPDDTTRDDTTLQTYDIAANDPRHLGIDPTIAAALAKIPSPNNTYLGDGLNTGGYLFRNPTYNDQNRFDLRLDHSLKPNHQIFLHLNLNNVDATDIYSNADASFPGQSSGTYQSDFWGFTAGSNYTINPQMVNEFRIGLLRPTTDLKRPDRSTGPMIVTNTFTDPALTSYPRSYNSKVFQVNDTLSHVRGKHIFKYGVDFSKIWQSAVDYEGLYPNVTFGLDYGNAPSEDIGPSEQLLISTQDRRTFEAMYNDLLGRMESVNQTYYSSLSSMPSSTPKKRNFTSQQYSGFVQDDWRIHPNITLNLGLRFEMGSVPKEINGYQTSLDKISQVSRSANISDFTFVTGNWHKNNLKNFAPRIGFAWDVFGTGSTVLRGGYGIYYDRLIGAITNFMDANSYGLSWPTSVHPNQSGNLDRRLSDGVPVIETSQVPPNTKLAASRSQSVAVLDPNLKSPRVDQYNLTLERRWGKTVWEAGYAGSRGRNLFQYLNLNQTKTQGGFLQAFHELQNYLDQGTLIPSTNPIVRVFGSAQNALNAVGLSNVLSNSVGPVADAMDTGYHSSYAAAGLSDFYIRNFPQFDKFIVGSSSGESWYNALHGGVRASGASYSFRANYTWSKSLDTMSSDGGALSLPFDSLNPRSNKAPSDFDRTHAVTLAFDVKLPEGKGLTENMDAPRWASLLLGNWNFGALYIWESGQRFSVYSGLETTYAGINSLADYSGKRNIGQFFKYDGVEYWLNDTQIADFSLPNAGSTGTSGRNSFTGPSYSNLDFTLFKNFPIGERQSFQFRVETYNLFNKVHWGLPNANYQDSNFGKITSTVGTPRKLQFGLRYQF